MNDINWKKCPVAHMTNSVYRYVERGIPPGHFLTALLSNDLMGAVGRADDENAAVLKEWAVFVHCELPNGCHGSPAAVSAWIKHQGLAGLSTADTDIDDRVPF